MCNNPQNSPHPLLNQSQRRLGISIHHPQQVTSGRLRPPRGRVMLRIAFGPGRPPKLFPIAHGGDWDAQPLGSVGPTARLRLCLAQLGLGADSLDVGSGHDTAPGSVALCKGDGVGQSGRDSVKCLAHDQRSYANLHASMTTTFCPPKT
jgi:hypothetical protein